MYLAQRAICIGYIIFIISCSVDQPCPTLQPHGLQHARLPCPSPSPRTCSNPCPLSQQHHPSISPSVMASPSSSNLFQHQAFSNEQSALDYQYSCDNTMLFLLKYLHNKSKHFLKSVYIIFSLHYWFGYFKACALPYISENNVNGSIEQKHF